MFLKNRLIITYPLSNVCLKQTSCCCYLASHPFADNMRFRLLYLKFRPFTLSSLNTCPKLVPLNTWMIIEWFSSSSRFSGLSSVSFEDFSSSVRIKYCYFLGSFLGLPSRALPGRPYILYMPNCLAITCTCLSHGLSHHLSLPLKV